MRKQYSRGWYTALCYELVKEMQEREALQDQGLIVENSAVQKIEAPTP